MDDVPDWKLKLRYGKTSTPYSHFTLIADGMVREANKNYSTETGPHVMSLSVWATDDIEAYGIIKTIGLSLGFEVTGKIEVYETDAKQPPGQNPSAYRATFTPYDEE